MTDPLEVAARPIFVVGFPRSGTTWTFDLLATHPEVAGVFESMLLTPENVAYLRAGTDYTTVNARTGLRVGLGQLIDRDDAILAARETLVSWLARAVGPEHRWLVEKTPAHAVTLDAVADVFPQARVVHVVRDVRDAIASRQDWRRGGGMRATPASALVMKPSVWRDSVEWDVTLRSVDAARARLPVHEIRYEQLHARPLETLRDLYAFCGIPADDDQLARIIAANDFARYARTGPGQFRRRGRVGSWRDELSLWTRALIAVLAGEALAAKGYLPRPPIANRLAFAVARRLGVGPT